VEFAQEIGSFALRKATTPSSAPSVAQIIDAIATKLQGEVSC
jgi:hypothetical protein